jgi:uncharacterized membrane protein
VTVGGLQALVVVLAIFCAWHAWTALGPRLAAAFLVITLVTSWTLEEVGVVTGLVYGPYHYTVALGPSIGAVPVLIPLAWFALAYPTSVLVDLVAGRWVGGSTGGPRRLVALAVAGALLMAAWDVALDPILSGPTYRAWVWEASGTVGAVPAQNYLGWAATAFAIYLAFRLVARRVPELGTPAVTAPAPAPS